MITLIVPWFGGNPEALENTIDSTAGLCHETVIVHQKLFDDDSEVAEALSDKVVTLDWNALFQDGGFGHLPNAGAAVASQPWMLLFGVGETFAESYQDFHAAIRDADPKTLFRCDHHGDVHSWKRVWRPDSGAYWSGPIHEEVGPYPEGPILFRMQDTPKPPHEDPFRNECMKWLKNCSYHANYLTLLRHPEKRGFCNEGWLDFVRGAKDSLEQFERDNHDLMTAGATGDREAFYAGVRRRMKAGEKPSQVNHNPLGQPMSEGATTHEH